jgi:hypothetical protein
MAKMALIDDGRLIDNIRARGLNIRVTITIYMV